MSRFSRIHRRWLRAMGLSVGLVPSFAYAAPPSEEAAPVDEAAASADESAEATASEQAPGEEAGTAEEDAGSVDAGAAEDAGPAEDAGAAEDAAPAEDAGAVEDAAPGEEAAPDQGEASVASEASIAGSDEPEFEAEEAHVDEGHGPSPPNPKIPPTGNTQMWFRSTTFFDYFGNNYDSNEPNNNDKFFALVNYLNVGSDTRLEKNWQISTMVRVDTHNVFNAKTQPLCDSSGDGAVSDIEREQCNFGADYRLERFQLRAGNKDFTITAGDFNVNFGRGIGLSIRKIADIGVDATIKGGRVDINTKHIDFTVIGGVTNRQQTDFATRQLFRDPGYAHVLCEQTPGLAKNKYGNPFWTMCSDIVSGGRFDTKLPGKVRLGGHYTFFWFGEPIGIQHDGMHSIGGDITRKRIAKHWDLFAGATVLLRNEHHRKNYPTLPETGIAAYLSNSVSFGDTFILVEGKYYDNYVVAKNNAATTVQYAEAPTLERADQIIPAAANTAGGRILVEQTVGKTRVTLIGNYLGYAYAITNGEDMFDPNVGEMLHHGYGGLRWRNIDKGIEIQAYAGYRWEGYQRAPDVDIKPYVRKLPHAEFYYNHQVAKSKGLAHSVSVRAEWRYEEVQKGNAPPKFFHRGNVILGYGLSPFLQLSLIGGYSSEFPPATSGPQLHPQPCTDEAACQRKPHLWPGAEARINFFESSFLRVFVGRQVGGLLCVNGSCRNLPDFEGVRMDLIFSF